MATSCLSSLPLSKASLRSPQILRSDLPSGSKKPYYPRRVALCSSSSELPTVEDFRPIISSFFSKLWLNNPRRANRGAAVAASAYTSDLDQQTSETETETQEEVAVELPEFESESSSDEKSEPEGAAAGVQGSKLYVGNLPWSCTSQQLAAIFQDYGVVEMVEVIYDRDTGRSRGFGFVTMSNLEGANSAIQSLNGAELEGRVLRVNFPEVSKGSFANSNRERRPRREYGSPSGGGDSTNKLFIGNIPWSVDNIELERIFSEHGAVLEAKVIFDRETGRSKGYGFVTLSSASEVSNAIAALDGTDCGGRSLRVNLAGEKSTRGESFA